MSESLVGFRVACTRQNAGRSPNCGPRPALPPRAGGVNAPAAIGCASVTVTFGNETDERLSHVAAPDVLATAAAERSAKTKVFCIGGI